MNETQLRSLSLRGTDVNGALRRFGGDEALYISCLGMFIRDTTIDELNNAIETRAWDDAFTSAHALKGLSGNMGFVPLMHATGQLVVLIRGGRIREIGDSMAQVNSSYRDIAETILANFTQKEIRGIVI